MEIRIVEARKQHLRIIEQHLTPGDKAEIEALGVSAREALYDGMGRSTVCKVALLDGRPACVFGLGPGPEEAEQEVMVPWMLSTDLVFKSPYRLVKMAREVVAGWSEEHKWLINTVHAKNAKAQEFIESVGFSFCDEVPLVIHPETGEKFRPFVLYGG
jgi:hypothetical protein